jgi:UrcA family protein
MMFKTSLVVSAALAAAIGLGGQASANRTDIRTESQRVPYGDLDLTTEAGAQTLAERIRLAAARVCQKASGGQSWIQLRRDYRDCVTDATQHAVAQVDKPAVHAVFEPDRPRQVASK